MLYFPVLLNFILATRATRVNFRFWTYDLGQLGQLPFFCVACCFFPFCSIFFWRQPTRATRINFRWCPFLDLGRLRQLPFFSRFFVLLFSILLNFFWRQPTRATRVNFRWRPFLDLGSTRAIAVFLCCFFHFAQFFFWRIDSIDEVSGCEEINPR